MITVLVTPNLKNRERGHLLFCLEKNLSLNHGKDSICMAVVLRRKPGYSMGKAISNDTIANDYRSLYL